MIVINNQLTTYEDLVKITSNTWIKNLISLMTMYREVYRYPSRDAFDFDISLKELTVQNAYSFHRSGVQFSNFRESRCNPYFWILGTNGQFILRNDRRPSDGLTDIFQNGYLYACECAVAMVIIFYKTVLQVIGEQNFNIWFSQLILYHWEHDKDLPIVTTKRNDFLFGDCLYFDNPMHLPMFPEWQGENVILLNDDLFFGHGIGITNSQDIIFKLNTKRVPNAQISAYLIQQATRLRYEKLYSFIQS